MADAVILGGRRRCLGLPGVSGSLHRQRHPDHREKVEWIGDGFDPEHFDIDEVNKN